MNALNSDLEVSKKGSNNVQSIPFKRTKYRRIKIFQKDSFYKVPTIFFEDLVF